MIIRVSFQICFLMALGGVASALKCYACSSTRRESRCRHVSTCEPGYACSNVIYRYRAATFYEKGCMARRQCERQVEEHEPGACQTVGSVCTHCCLTDLCNGGVSQIRGGNSRAAVSTWVLALVAARLLCALLCGL